MGQVEKGSKMARQGELVVLKVGLGHDPGDGFLVENCIRSKGDCLHGCNCVWIRADVYECVVRGCDADEAMGLALFFLLLRPHALPRLSSRLNSGVL